MKKIKEFGKETVELLKYIVDLFKNMTKEDWIEIGKICAIWFGGALLCLGLLELVLRILGIA